jgi:serine/threonine-protein kinase HipA
LFGALRDATPDAWGRRVIENKLRAPPNSLPESVYLDHAGPHRAGALDVRPRTGSPARAGALPGAVELQHLLEAADRIAEGLPVPAHLESIFVGGPTLGGARPKAVVEAHGRQWIAKFPSPNDPFDVPEVERATLELARQAGLDVPRTRRVAMPDGRVVMLVERFDRVGAGAAVSRVHMVTALTLTGLDETQSRDASYAGIARAIERFGAPGHVHEDRTELFRRMVFNVLVSNDDDHLRNHAFLLADDRRGWRLSPLYDVVPRPSLATERYLHLAVGPRGRVATLDHALESAGQFGLDAAEAARSIDALVRVVREWRRIFDDLGVPARESERIAPAFRRASEIGMRAVEQFL